jgi:SAM-dependent methyltransferase
MPRLRPRPARVDGKIYQPPHGVVEYCTREAQEIPAAVTAVRVPWKESPQRMGIKDQAKRYIGDTFIWRYLTIARFHARRLKGALIPRLPKWFLYRLLQKSDFYGEEYFDKPKNPLEVSGYGEAYEGFEEFKQVAGLSRELFDPHRVLDVGCAKGFLVGALRSRAMEAWGIDISDYAVKAAPADVRDWLKVGNCTSMDFRDNSFDLLVVLETLEHIPPTDIAKTLRELRRVGSQWLWASTPSMGENPYGPDGIAEGKIQDGYLGIYRDNVIDLAPFKHLILDLSGMPIHGHLTIASYAWWTASFNRWGFVRRGDLERKVNEDLENARQGIWNCTVFEKAASPPGARPAKKAVDLPFTGIADGIWEAEAIHLPAGVHLIDLELAVEGIKEGGEPARRALHCEGTSVGGDRVNASLLMNVQEALRAGRKGHIEARLVCAACEDSDVRLRISCAPALRVKPLPVTSIQLHRAP